MALGTSAVRRRPAFDWLIRNWAVLSTMAHDHGVFGYLGRALRTAYATPPGGTATDITVRNAATAARHMHMVADLVRLGSGLDARGIPWAGFKGPYLTRLAHHGAVHLRSYGDIDILVQPRDLGNVLALTEELGGLVVAEDYASLIRRRAGEIHLRLAGGTVVDLHWDLVNSAQRRDDFAVPDAASLLARRVTVEIEGRRLWTLHPVDTAVHVAMHATLSGGHRLIWPLDVAGVWDSEAVGHRELRDTVVAWRAELPVAVALGQVQFLRGKLPDSAAALEPVLRHPWVEFCRWCWHKDVKQSRMERLTPGRWMLRSTRTTGPRSLLEGARYAVTFPTRKVARRSASDDDPGPGLADFLQAVRSFENA